MNFPIPLNSSTKIQLLYVEDDRIDRLAFTRYVKQMELPYEYTLANSLSEALEILCDRTFQIALLDYNLGDGLSSELFPILKEKNCPFVISTGSGDEETAARLMSQGAADYLIKDPDRNYLKILPATIDKTLSRHQNEGRLNLLNSAMRSVKDSIFILDDEGRLQYVNNALAEFSNISPEAAIGQPIQVLNQPYLEEWLRDIRSCSDESCSTETEILMCRADGTNFLALVSESCVLENTHINRVGVIRDVTSLKEIELELRNYQEGLENVVEERTSQLQQAIADLQQENQERLKAEAELKELNVTLEARVESRTRELQEREAQLRDLFDNATDLIQSISPEGNFLFVNRAWQEALGYSEAELEHLSIFQVIHPEDIIHCQTAMQRLFTGEKCIGIETRFSTKDGRTIVVEGNVNCHLKDDIPVSTRGIFRDITERKETEKALEESQRLLQTVLDCFPLAVFWKDLQSIIVGCNQFFASVTGLTSSREAVGKNNFDFSYSEEEALRYTLDDREVMESGVPKIGIQETIASTDGSIKWLETNKIPLIDSLGEVVGIVCTFQDISDRKQAELEKQKTTERLALALKSGAIGCWEWNIQQNIGFWDDRMYELYGLCKETDSQIVCEIWANSIHPDDLAANEMILQQIATGQIDEYDTEFRVVYPDGSIHFNKAYGTLKRDANGNPLSVTGINFDISDRKQAEQIILQQANRETLLRGITQRIRQSLDLPIIFDTACQEIQQLLQCDRVGVFKFCPESNFDNGVFVAESVADGFISVMEVRIHDHCFGEGYAAAYAQGRMQVVNDIDNAGLIDCHRNVLAQFQIRANLVIPLICGSNLWGLLCIHQCANTRQWQEHEINLIQQIANQLAIALQQASLFEQSQQEIAERKQAQQQLTETNQQLARATRLKDEFLANMSHELRTPLNSILGMNEALQDEVFGSINDRQLKALQTIENSSTHLLALINDILDVAKIESGQVTLELTAIELDSLCKSSLAFIKQQALTKRIQLIHRIPKNLPEIMLDERRIRQVLINLLNNAVKFTIEGGTITLEVSQVRIESSTTNLTPLNYLKIAVIDTGIGISAENIQKLFQPFIQIDSALNRQYTGTGLGLALVRRLVELHGGNVELTSELGVGSCFAINLPFNIGSSEIEEQTKSALSEQAQIAQSETEELISPLILLAEDNEANIVTFSSYLEAKGYRILLATDGQQAIDLAKAHHPDLILMDIQMPVIDGIEAIKQIRLDPNLADISIIALTALAMAGDREKCLEAGANEYLSKPIKLKQVATIIQQIFVKNSQLLSNAI